MQAYYPGQPFAPGQPVVAQPYLTGYESYHPPADYTDYQAINKSKRYRRHKVRPDTCNNRSNASAPAAAVAVTLVAAGVVCVTGRRFLMDDREASWKEDRASG